MRSLWAALLSLAITAPALAGPAPPLPQRVLYVGNLGGDRERAFTAFLKVHCAGARSADRDGFAPSAAAPFDVVVLDWSQGDVQRNGRFEFPYPEARLKSPLGPREAWTKPTVLIGSAGHLLAACWQVHGGSG